MPTWTPPAYAVPPVPQPPAPPRKARHGLLALLIALPLVLVVTASAVLGITLTRDKPVTDDRQQVTLTVPWSWTELTDEEIREDPDDDEDDSYVDPDLVAEGVKASVAVFVEPRVDATTASGVHAASVDSMCDVTECADRGRAKAVTVNGRRGVEQVLRHPDGDVTLVLTVEARNVVANVIGYAYDGDEDVALAVMRTVRIND